MLAPWSTKERMLNTPHSPSDQEHVAASVDREPLISLRLSVDGSLLRLSPAWVAVAGALTAAVPVAGGIVRLVVAALLAECVWGLMSQTRYREDNAGHSKISRQLPYIQPDALAARAVSALRSIGSSYGDWRTFVGAAGLMILLSLVLGHRAMFITLIAVLLSMWTMGVPQRGEGLSGSILAVGLPWLLGQEVSVSTAALFSKARVYGLTLALGFTLLHWGIQRYRLNHGQCVSGMVAGQLLVLSALIIWLQPSAVAIVAGLWLPSTYWMMNARHLSDKESILRNSAFWWWAALIAVAVTPLWGK